MGYQTLQISRQGAVEVIALNRPDVRNSMNQALRFELRKAIDIAMSEERVRVVVLAGEGKCFCAGGDLQEQLPGADRDGFITEQIRTEFTPIIRAITNGPKPVIGAINGAAAGIGGAFALACDLLVMSDDAFIYSAFGAIGLVPDGGMHLFLRNALGSKKAYEMISLSQRLSAQQCENLGIANRVVAADSLREEAMNMADQLCQQAPLSLRYAKQLIGEAAEGNLENILDREAVIQNITLRSEDFQEGSRAFFEKRAAQFIGR